MNQTDLVKYETLFKIIFRNGDVEYVKAEGISRKQLEADINNNKVITINGKISSTYDIKCVELHDGRGYEFLPKEQRIEVEERIKKYQSNIGKYPSDGTIRNIVKRVAKI